MKLNEIVFRILNELQGGSVSDDHSYDERMIVSLIGSYRARLLKQERDVGKWVSGHLIQDLGRVELIKADKHNCSVIEDCILRTLNPIPQMLDTNASVALTFCGTLDGQKFERTTYTASQYLFYNKFTSRIPRYYDIGEYYYIYNPKYPTLKYINIQGIFTDPLAANSFKTCGNTLDCYEDYDFEYPVSAHMVDAIVKLCIEEIKTGMMTMPDTLNDSNDNI